MLKRKCLLTYISVFWLSILSNQAFAFGADGHRIITKIAENHLSEKTVLAIDAITGDSDLSRLSLWPDRIRGTLKWRKSSYWHYINIADHETFETAKRSSKGDVLSALNDSYQQLANTTLTDSERLEALSFFIHFAGDIHQPLHVGRSGDRGGNSIAIKWPKKKDSKKKSKSSGPKEDIYNTVEYSVTEEENPSGNIIKPVRFEEEEENDESPIHFRKILN